MTFEQLSAVGPFEAWNLVPLIGKMQIIFTIAGLEHASESLNPDGHYTKGGTPGDLKFLVRHHKNRERAGGAFVVRGVG